MATFRIRAASCPNCHAMFEASSKRKQRCPSCGYRFALGDAAQPMGFGASQLQAPAYSPGTRHKVPARAAYSNGDRLTGAVLVASAGAGLIWLGMTVGLSQVAAAGVVVVAFVLLSALMSSFWRRYEDLSPGQQAVVDLPRRVVWTLAQVVWTLAQVLWAAAQGVWLLLRFLGPFGV